ncbi:MAG: Uma2 family endonuclease, partial [bacterium]|nr:Uma2 family endonuclease [bacterium]
GAASRSLASPGGPAAGAARGPAVGSPVVCSERNLYYRPFPDAEFVVPDVFVCFGVDPGPLELAVSYRLWESGAPAFVLEIASKSTQERDLDEKPAIYREMGAGEYWRLDPTGGEFYTPMLQGDRLAGGAWEPIAAAPDGGGLRGRSAALGLDLFAEEGRLRFGDPRTGLWLPDHEDTRHALQQTRRQRDAAEAARRAAEAARRAAEDRADVAEAELAALRARLNDQDGESPQ